MVLGHPSKPVKMYYAASSAQKRMYALSQLANCGTAYNVPCIFRGYGRLDIQRAESAFGKMIQRHESSARVLSSKMTKLSSVQPSVDFGIHHFTAEPGSENAAIRAIRPFDLSSPS